LLPAELRAESGTVSVSATVAGHLAFVWVTEAFCRLTGYAAPEVLGRPCALLQGPETHPGAVGIIEDSLQQGRDTRAIMRHYRRDGSTFWNAVHVRTVPGTPASPTWVVVSHEDVTGRVEGGRHRLDELATTDPVTGLANGEALRGHLQQLLDRARESGCAVVLVLLRVDGFADVDAASNFRAADQVMVALAERLGARVTGDDLLARADAKTFAVVRAAPRPLADRAAAALVEDLQEATEEPVATASVDIPVALSCTAIVSGPQDTAACLLARRPDVGAA
jgi:PAS domain S-box-containing protein/diguanylate cyclase (GGDEF)-like protein